MGANLVRLDSLLIDSIDPVGEDELFACGSQVVCVFGLSFANNRQKSFKQAYAPQHGASDDDLVESDIGVVVYVRTPNDLFLGLGRP